MLQGLDSAAQSVGSLSGWRRNLFAFAFGICATLTLAPFYLFVFLLPAFTGLIWLLDGAATKKRAFLDGWWWGWGFYISGLYWFCIALLTDPEAFAWLIPFALFALTGVIALYSGIACLLYHLCRMKGLSRLVVFSGIWVVVEFARGHLLTGFPWNLPGYAFGFSNISLQVASLIGAYGLTWFAVLLGGSLAALTEKKREQYYVFAVWGLFILSIGFGAIRLQAETAYVPGIKLRLVQANIAQPHKWDPKLQMAGMQEHARLTRAPGLENITHVIWPETSIPYVLKGGTPLSHALGSSVPDNAFLIAGSLRAAKEGADDFQVWNNMAVINPKGDIVGSYDKVQLVPFGEFLPFRSLLPAAWLTPVGSKDFSSGPGAAVEHWPGLPPLRPLICYEAIFPDLPPTAEAPQWLLNITNDAWFGLSSGPYQHFHMARMRTVEQGVPLVRAANTGISAVVDSYGRVLSSLPLGAQGVLDEQLPTPAAYPTIYDLYGGKFLLFLVFTSGILIIRQRRTQ